MLVLTRKVGEKLRLGKEITVEVVRVNGNRVRLGVVAPPEVLVLRDELPKHPDTPPEPAKIPAPAPVPLPEAA